MRFNVQRMYGMFIAAIDGRKVLSVTKLICMRGYPGSGKSTLAKDIARENKGVVVCRDDLRKMLHNDYFTGRKECEDQVTVAEHAQVEALLKAGVSVVADATHLNFRYLHAWRAMAVKHRAGFHVQDVRTSPDECIEWDRIRAAGGGRGVGERVIRQLAKRFPMHKWPTIKPAGPFVPEPVEPMEGLPPAIIVDIDGTLAHTDGKRSPYDYSRVDEDRCDQTVKRIVDDWRYGDRNGSGKARGVIILSGRDNSCYRETSRWLYENYINHDMLLMRPEDAKDENGNKLPDYLVKYELFNKHVRGYYDVQFVLDDRNQVVKLWRDMGLKCFQVQEGNF